MVERDLAKVDVAGSTPVSRSNFQRKSLAAATLFPPRNRARYPSGKGEVCKTFIRRFDSDPRLHFIHRVMDRSRLPLRSLQRVPVVSLKIFVKTQAIWVVGSEGRVPDSRMARMSLIGGRPKKRLYSRLNWVGLS